MAKEKKETLGRRPMGEAKKEAQEKQHKALDSAMKEIKEKYGEGSIMKLSESNKVNVDTIPTGSIAMDMALGVGGMPRGRIIEIYGAESRAKTPCCLPIVAKAKKKAVCALILMPNTPWILITPNGLE